LTFFILADFIVLIDVYRSNLSTPF